MGAVVACPATTDTDTRRIALMVGGIAGIQGNAGHRRLPSHPFAISGAPWMFGHGDPLSKKGDQGAISWSTSSRAPIKVSAFFCEKTSGGRIFNTFAYGPHALISTRR
jgi:hypothetical protein